MRLREGCLNWRSKCSKYLSICLSIRNHRFREEERDPQVEVKKSLVKKKLLVRKIILKELRMKRLLKVTI
jgi:hypothetical protein